MEPQNNRPTRAGQSVEEVDTGRIGITTSTFARSAHFGVIFLGDNYPVKMSAEDLRLRSIYLNPQG